MANRTRVRVSYSLAARSWRMSSLAGARASLAAGIHLGCSCRLRRPGGSGGRGRRCSGSTAGRCILCLLLYKRQRRLDQLKQAILINECCALPFGTCQLGFASVLACITSDGAIANKVGVLSCCRGKSGCGHNRAQRGTDTD